MNKEIGGYFGLEQRTADKGEYYPSLLALNTARNALVYLLRARKIRKLYIPYLLCDSVSLVCEREGFSYEYYHTDEQFRPVFERSLTDGEWLYVVNLYGQLENETLTEYQKIYGRIIVDNIHAFFQKPIPGVDTVYSCRKFFGVPDGAYLATDVRLPEVLPVDDSANRTSHIFGRIKDGASAHYAEFCANDALFETLPLMQMSNLTHQMLRVIDYDTIRTVRERNYAFLHRALGEKNKLSLRLPEGPYAYPFYCENGLEVKKKLAEKKIYVATLWRNVFDLDCQSEKDYAANILPLPCDQRYGEEEIHTVTEVLQSCWKL